VTATAGYSVGQQARIDNEVMIITAIPSSTSLTVTRGSSPAAHSSGANVTGPLATATMQIYDCVFDHGLNLHHEQTVTQIYNNLFLGPMVGGGAGGSPTWIYYADMPNVDSCYDFLNGQIWNNVVASSATAFLGLQCQANDYVALGPSAPLSYMDYNVYALPNVANPVYDFESGMSILTSLTMPQWQAKTPPGEQHSSVVTTLTTVYQDTVHYVLNTPYTTAGRYGDAVGPRVVIDSSNPNGIMNTSRYGPGAIGSYR
jgi:hypothetical protein